MTPTQTEAELEQTVDLDTLQEWRGTVRRGDLVIMREFSHHVPERTLSVESKYRLAGDTVDVRAFTVDSQNGIDVPVAEFCQQYHTEQVDSEVEYIEENFDRNR